MTSFFESSERISAAKILSQLRFRPISTNLEGTCDDSSTLECAHILLATSKSHIGLHSLVSKDFLHKTVIFKRPHVTLGSAFQPPEKSNVLSKVEDKDFEQVGPIPKKLKLNPSACARTSSSKKKATSSLHNLFTTRKEECSLDMAQDMSSITEMQLESESSLLSPPLSPQFEDEFTPELPREKVSMSSAKRLRRDSELNPSVGRKAPKKEEKCPSVAKPVSVVGRNRQCISCHITQTPCWRPSWDPIIGQLCNSCGLRYRKTQIRCSSAVCANVPSKLDLAAIRAQCRGSHLQCPKCKSLLIKD